MLKSFCLKTNNKSIISYLLSSFKKDIPNDFCLSKKSFKIYENVIFHYTGDYEELYVDYVADKIKDVILNFYENKLITNILNYDYFYFSDIERKEIFKSCIESLNDTNNTDANSRKNIIFYSCKEYVKENNAVILDGFAHFRIKEYINILAEIVDICVNSYVIEKEYLEFINLLKKYIESKCSSNDIIHLIYLNQESILLDNKKNVIQLNDEITNAKYLSDITFSSNDYCLNTLLNLLPKKIYIHLLDEIEDAFIITLKSIFGKRVSLCFDCSMCNFYKSQHILTKK